MKRGQKLMVFFMKEKTFKIRQCLDILLIKELHAEILPTDDWYETKSICWVAYCGEIPVGFAMLSLQDNKIAYLARSGVLLEYRGYGLQRRLIRAREMFARKLNFTKIITYTKIYNINSINNLQKCGYWLYEPEEEYADADCLYWIKELK